ncbi:MAG: nitrous oxide reductase family maturation protein NosD [Nitrosomonadales bacterium]|nr:nitrous oxide reductase family maturation protein NosD [Nitrosomonadales bacterium]
MGVALAASLDDDDSAVETAGHSVDLSTAPRVDVNAPTQLVPLYERDKRIHGLPPFQALVDAAPEGSTLRPKPGLYAGPVHLTKKLTIDGGGQATIDGGDKGTVFVLETNGVVLRGIHLTGSGSSHDTDDACLNVRGHNNNIENLVIDNCLFGIDLKQSNNNIVRGNNIRSKVAELGARGDGLRLWYSMKNRIEGNTVVDSRDMVVWYSSGNYFLNNQGAHSRYSIHFMFANDNVLEGNRFYDNSVGVYLMYTENTTMRNNVISHSNGSTGMGIGFKEASSTLLENNEIIYNAVGLSADLSPFQPDTKIILKNNRIAYNGIAISFNSGLEGYDVTGNTFEGNITNMAVAAGGNARSNLWHGNYWDDYEGFDRNNDGVGDTPYELYDYADRIWMEIPYARFFKNAPLMEAIDFLEKLAPFSSPDLMLRDDAPLFHKPVRART